MTLFPRTQPNSIETTVPGYTDSSKPPRSPILRSGLPTLQPYPCENCGLIVVPWRQTVGNTGRCSECSHYNNDELRQKIATRNEILLCPCPWYHTINPAMRLCVCSCECYIDQDQDQSDTDYEFVEEVEDDIEEQLTILPTQAEETLARNYGWQTNVISNAEIDEERRIFYEAPGHNAVARMHDIGLPAESSLANCENRVGHIEIRKLIEHLHPWELEAVHQSTGLSYNELSKIFPETGLMQLPTNWTSCQQPVLFCSHCNLLRSDEFMEWLQSGTMSTCSFCGMTRQPANPDEDPDFCNFNAGIQDTSEHCHCRCYCDLNDYRSPTAEVDPTFTAAMIEQALSCTICNHDLENSSDDGPSLDPRNSSAYGGYDANHSDVPLPRPAEIDSGEPLTFPQMPIGSINLNQTTSGERAEIRFRTGLPSLRFSNDPRLELRQFQNIRMALDDADLHSERESFEVALRYAEVAASWCEEGTLPRLHPLCEEVCDILCELRAMLDEEGDAHTSSDIDIGMSSDEDDCDSTG